MMGCPVISSSISLFFLIWTAIHGVVISMKGTILCFSTFELIIIEIEGMRHTKVWDAESEVKLLKAVEK